MVIELLIILFAIAFSCGLTLLIPVGFGYHYFAPILLLIAGYIIGFFVIFGVLYLYSLIYHKDKYTSPKKAANFWLTQGEKFLLFHARVKIKVIENSPIPNERFLLVCNHRSNFDPMVISSVYGKLGLAFISKQSNFKIPIVGRLMRASAHLAIDREDRLKALETIKDATDLILNDRTSIAVFPEGTRNHDGILQPFHEGVYNIAIKGEAPIVIASLKGTERINKNFPWKKTVVTLKIITVMYPSDYQNMVAKTLSDYSRVLIDDSLR